MEELITDPNSALYKLPDGTVAGKDWRQYTILKYIHAAEKKAKIQMMKEFPVILKTQRERLQFSKDKINEAKKSYLDKLVK